MEENKLSIVTGEMLDRTDYLKKCVKESMSIGYVYIIKGIIIFEEVLKNINPFEMSDNVIDTIQMRINDILEKRELIFNHYCLLGIKRCYFIAYDYNLVQKTRKMG